MSGIIPEPWGTRVHEIVDEAHRENWGGKHREGFCEACADAHLIAQYAVPGGPGEPPDPLVRLRAIAHEVADDLQHVSDGIKSHRLPKLKSFLAERAAMLRV